MRKRISDLIVAVSIVLLTVTAMSSALQIHPAKVYGATLAVTHSVVMSPMTLILNTLPLTVNYWVNVTSTGTDYINETDIKIPTGWTDAGTPIPIPGYGFGIAARAGGWLNFTTALATFNNGAIANFSIPVTISTIPSGTISGLSTGTWTVNCNEGTTVSANNPITITVEVDLQFHSTMTPNYVRNGTSYVYTITVTNDAAPTGIIEVDITFPAGQWTFNALLQSSPATWTVTYNLVNTFVLTGPNLYTGSSASITVNMTTPAGAPTGEYFWAVSALNAGSQYLGTYSMKAVVDSSKPTVAFLAPTVSYYSVGIGNYMWINASISDTPSIETYGINVNTNDSRFQLYPSQPRTEVSPTQYTYYFVNVTAIPDGPLAVLVSATDPAGNTGTGTAQTTVDNTKPALTAIYVTDQYGNYLHQDSSGTYWMKAGTLNISVAAVFYNPSNFAGKIYFNSTSYTFANNTWLPGYGILGFNVAGANLVTVNITLTDGALPTANRYTNTWTVMRDIIPPSAPSYTRTTPICGGVIIYGLTATDNVGINEFDVWVNGTPWSIDPFDLYSGYLSNYYYGSVIANITVVNFGRFGLYAGDMANVTLDAMDYGSNVGPSVTFFMTVPAGQWYALELQPKWNLISFPLLPNSTSTANIFSLLLVNGASGVNFAYSFDNTAKTWTLNPTSMSDGNAYWLNMKAYDVLIVQGFPNYAPPGSPPPIVEYNLKTGWNLAGFTETDYWYAPDYVASLQSTLLIQSYFRYAYVWDAYAQNWYTVDLLGSYGTTYFSPGQGFYIYLYSDQALIPPV